MYALAPSPLDAKRIWAGTDDGLIHVTTDGGASWTNVTPQQLVPWAKVSILEASHFDANTAYAAINTFRLDDLRPHILRTRDGGKSWVEITSGIPSEGIINVVREDPKQRGLLFAGSEREVFVSFDDGDRWQSLRLNMPATSIRDLVLHDNDVVVATHGRGFWILDDIAPLRNADASTHLVKPSQAWRFRWNKYTDTPLPPDEPMGQNPPDGAVIDYVLASPAQSVALEILNASGKVVRRYSSDDKPAYEVKDTGNWPWYWFRKPQMISRDAGMHRLVWDLHYAPLPSKGPSLGINAVPFNTAPNYSSPWVLPGTYTVRLSVDGKTSTQPLVVKMDPRVTASMADLTEQFNLSMRVYEALQSMSSSEEEDDEGPPSTAKPPARASSLRTLLNRLQAADVAPTEQLKTAVAGLFR